MLWPSDHVETTEPLKPEDDPTDALWRSFETSPAPSCETSSPATVNASEAAWATFEEMPAAEQAKEERAAAITHAFWPGAALFALCLALVACATAFALFVPGTHAALPPAGDAHAKCLLVGALAGASTAMAAGGLWLLWMDVQERTDIRSSATRHHTVLQHIPRNPPRHPHRSKLSRSCISTADLAIATRVLAELQEINRVADDLEASDALVAARPRAHLCMICVCTEAARTLRWHG